jgi:hypothetical protein
MDVDSSESGSPYIRHFYACPDCDYKGWVYDDTYLHILRKHFKIFIEPEFLKNKDCVQALKELDRISILKRSCHGVSPKNIPKIQLYESEILQKVAPKRRTNSY